MIDSEVAAWRQIITLPQERSRLDCEAAARRSYAIAQRHNVALDGDMALSKAASSIDFVA